MASVYPDKRILKELLSVSLALNDLPTASSCCECILKKTPNDKDALWNLAIFKLKTCEADLAADLFSRFFAVTTSSKPVMKPYINSLMNPKLHDDGIPYIASFKNVMVDTEYWSILDGHKAYFRDVHDRTMPNSMFVEGRATADGKKLIYSVPEDPVTIESPCILLGGDDNYSHWLTRNLIKLSLLEGRPEEKSHLYLINSDLYEHQRQYLELLGIPEDRLIKTPKNGMVRCNELLVPSLLRNRPQMHNGIAWLRDKMKHIMSSPEDADNLIYLSRRDTKVRALLNEQDLEDELSKLGFQIIVASDLSVREQIKAFSRAKVVVSPHGAGLTNIIFSPPHAKILEICSANIFHMEDFRVLARELGQEIHTVIVTDYSCNSDLPEGHVNREFSVDIHEVISTLKENRYIR